LRQADGLGSDPAGTIQNIGRDLPGVLFQNWTKNRSLPGDAMVPILKHQVIRLSQVVIKGFYRFAHFRLLQKSIPARSLDEVIRYTVAQDQGQRADGIRLNEAEFAYGPGQASSREQRRCEGVVFQGVQGDRHVYNRLAQITSGHCGTVDDA
jgi:hypothetical protein